MTRLILILLVAGVAGPVKSQLSVMAGVTGSGLLQPTRQIERADGRYTWRAGIRSEFPVHQTSLLYAGLTYENLQLDVNRIEESFGHYRQILEVRNLSLDMGFGRKIKLGSDKTLKIYGGVFIAMAIGGRFTYLYEYATANRFVTESFEEDMRFGNGYGSLRRWNWGPETAASFSYKKWQIELRYQLALNRLNSKQFYSFYNYQRGRWSSVSAELSYQMFNFHKKAK